MYALAMQGVMRHIQALLYRSLRHKLLQGRATAPLAKRHPVGPDAAAVVDAAVGDIYGEVRRQRVDVRVARKAFRCSLTLGTKAVCCDTKMATEHRRS
jgi:hypothetical protein